MSEALLTGEPQTPTNGTTAAQAPAKDTSSVPEQGKQPSPAVPVADASKGLLAEGKPGAAKAPTEPIKYEFKLEGERKLSEPVQKAYEAAVREHGLSNEAANKMLNSLAQAVAESTKSRDQGLIKSWSEALATDKEIGGDKLDENLASARKALGEFGSDGLRELLKGGLEHHPEIIRLLAKVSRTVGGDRIVTGAPSASPASDMAKVFYPNMA